MLEDTKINGFLVGLNAPRDRMFGFDIYPADQIGLE